MQYMDQVIKMIGIEYGEFFTVKGRNHVGHQFNGMDEPMFVFVEYGMHKAMWPADVNKSIVANNITHLPLDVGDFHAIMCGMLTIIRSKPEKRKFLPKYAPDKVATIKDTCIDEYQSTLF